MDTENDTNAEVGEDSTGLLERFDELFTEDGDPKNGTAELLDEADTTQEESESPETEATQEATEADESEADASEEAEEAEETEESAEEASEESDEEKDDFDKETEEKVAEMATDAHPGIKFAELRQELKEAKQALQERQGEVENTEEVQKLKLQAERTETLEAEISELRKQLSIADYSTTPEYKEQVEKPINDLQSLADMIEKTNSIPEGSIYRAVSMADQVSQNKAIESLVEEFDLNRREEVRLYNMADDLVKVQNTQEHLKKQAETRMSELNEMQVSQTTEQREQQEREIRNQLKSTFERYNGKLPGFIDDEGMPNDTWKDLEKVSMDSSISSVEDEAHAIFAANALPYILDHVKDLSTQIKEKNVLLARYTKAKPSNAVKPTQAEPKQDSGGTFMDRLNNLKF